MPILRTAVLILFVLVSAQASAAVMLSFKKYVSVDGTTFFDDSVEVAESPVAEVTWRFLATVSWDATDIVTGGSLVVLDDYLGVIDVVSPPANTGIEAFVTEFDVDVPLTNNAGASFTWYPCAEPGTCETGFLQEIDSASITVAQSQVPEPTTLALLGIGLAGLGFTRRRTK